MSVKKKFLQPTKETSIKPSLLIVTNAKDNDIVDLIYNHTFLNSLLLYTLVNIPPYENMT